MRLRGELDKLVRTVNDLYPRALKAETELRRRGVKMAACPKCGRQSGLSGVDGGPCLECSWPALFTWLRGLRRTADVNGKVFRSVPDPLWPLALDVIEAIETGDRCLFCNAYYDDPEGHREDCVVGAFIAAAEKGRM